MRTSKEVRDDNKMLRFQVEVLWKNLKEERARRDHLVCSRREGAQEERRIMDALKAENADLRLRLVNCKCKPTMSEFYNTQARMMGEDALIRDAENVRKSNELAAKFKAERQRKEEQSSDDQPE